MKIRITKDFDISSIINNIYPNVLSTEEKAQVNTAAEHLLTQEQEFLRLKVNKYYLSEFITLNDKNITLFIRSDNLLDKIKRFIKKYV